MGLIVQKFGGSSVRDRERLLRAMRIVRRTWEQGDDVVVVLSAQGDTTDALLARARELTEEPPPRELDALLATGETASVALGAIALASLGVPAVSLSGWQVPVGTDGTHGGANVRSVGAERIRQELAQELKADENPKLAVGDGARLCWDYLNSHGIPCRLAPENALYQSAVGVALAAEDMARRGETVSGRDLVPTYLRLSQAERERLAKGLKITVD